MTAENTITVLAVSMIAAFHDAVREDRLLLNLYYISIVAAAYCLTLRHKPAHTIFVVSLAAATTLAQVYFSVESRIRDPLLDPVINMASLFVLFLLSWRLLMHAIATERERREFEVERALDRKVMETRAAALASTSHEVRTPISAILCITENLLDECAGPLDETVRELVGDIDECGRHLSELVNDILDYAKAEAGQIHIVRETVALPDLVQQCVSVAQRLNDQPERTFLTHVEPSVNEIHADPLRLKQIMLNLLSNALKYSPADGVIKVQVRADGDHVLIGVRDSGPGISGKKLKNLFDPYYQAANCDQGIGTGLGLAITKHLVELHGGSIGVDSVPGTGTLFTVHLPAGSETLEERNLEQHGDATWDVLNATASSRPAVSSNEPELARV